MINEERRINSLDYAMYEFLDQIGKPDLAKDLLEGVIQYYYESNYYGDNEFVKEYLKWVSQGYLDRIIKENYMELMLDESQKNIREKYKEELDLN